MAIPSFKTLVRGTQAFDEVADALKAFDSTKIDRVLVDGDITADDVRTVLDWDGSGTYTSEDMRKLFELEDAFRGRDLKEEGRIKPNAIYNMCQGYARSEGCRFSTPIAILEKHGFALTIEGENGLHQENLRKHRETQHDNPPLRAAFRTLKVTDEKESFQEVKKALRLFNPVVTAEVTDDGDITSADVRKILNADNREGLTLSDVALLSLGLYVPASTGTGLDPTGTEFSADKPAPYCSDRLESKWCAFEEGVAVLYRHGFDIVLEVENARHAALAPQLERDWATRLQPSL